MSSPKWKIFSNKVELIGCKYQSTVNLNKYAYWLFDGTQKVEMDQNNEDVSLPLPVLGSKDGLMEFEMPPLRIKSFKTIGDYQCVIENKLVRKKSIKSLQLSKDDLESMFFLFLLHYNVYVY